MKETNLVDDPTFNALINTFYILGFGLLSMVYVGCNRLIAIPILYEFIAAGSQFMYWYTVRPIDAKGNTRVNDPVVAFFAYTFYTVGEFIIVFYGYFILEKILPRARDGWVLSRKVFIYIFWPLQILSGCIRICAIIIPTIAATKYDNNRALNDKLFKIYLYLSQATFLVVAIIEIFSAYLLLTIFRRSRKIAILFLGGKRLGLFKHLLLSTEIRVTSIAFVSILRAGSQLGTWQDRSKENTAAFRISSFAVDLTSLFPILLIADCIFRKCVGLEMQLQEGGQNNGKPPTAAQQLGIISSEHNPTVVDSEVTTAPEEDLEKAVSS